jgi:exopolysaccharide production protein ExoZ
MEVISIQYLRGCAALMVVFHHLGLQLRRVGYEGYWPTFLSSGVDIFFVISGFVMCITTQREVTALEFFRRRITRVVPLYWLLTSFVLATLLAFPKMMRNDRLDPMHVLSSYLFFPAVHPTQRGMFPLLIPGWSLNYEMFFYAIFGLGLLLPGVNRLVVVSGVLCALVTIPSVVTVPPLTAEAFYTSSKLLEFVYGIALGWLFGKRFRLPAVAAWLCMLVGAAVIASGDIYLPPDLLSGIPPLLVVTGAVMIERSHGVANVAALHLLGNASYSIYLSHTIALAFVLVLWLKAPFGSFPGGLFVFGSLEVAAAVTAAVLLYFYVEKPLLRLGKLRIFRVSPARQ